MQQHENHRNTRRGRKRVKDRNHVWKNNDRKLSEPGKEKNHAHSGSTEGPNQDEPRHIIIKMPSFKVKDQE